MSETEALAERLRVLEQEVADIKRQLRKPSVNGNWVDEISGSMKEFPDFDEVVRLGQELRRSQKDPGE
jgi:hypothetical protein